MSGFLFGSCGPCCERCSCLKMSWSIVPDGNRCVGNLQGTWTVKIPEWANGNNVEININGTVDDDITINGQIIDAGKHIFNCGLNGAHYIGGTLGYGYLNQKRNGHERSVTREFTVGVIDNHGGGTGMDICICLSPNDTQYECPSKNESLPAGDTEFKKIGGWQVKADGRAARSVTTLSVCKLEKQR